MKKILLLTILSVGVAMSAFAQEKKDDIKHLLKLTSSEQLTESIMNSMVSGMKMQFGEQMKNSADREKYEKTMEKLMAEVVSETKELTRKLIDVDMVDIYDKYFTHQEIKELISFYESPAGKKLIEKSPVITSELMNIMMTKYMPDFQTNLKSKMEEFKK